MQHSFIRFLFLCAAMALATNTAYSADPAAPAPAREIKISDTQFVRGGQTPAWIRESPIPATTKTQPAVTRLADTQFRIDKNELTYVRRVIQVNDSSALAQIGQLQLDFAPEYSKLHLLSLRILRGTQVIDLTKTVDVRFLQREAKLENGTYSGTVTASLVLNDVRVGDTMDLRYMTEGANPVFGGKFSDWASWDQPNPTELRSIIVSHPVNRSLKWQGVSDLREFTAKPEITERNGYRYLEWTVQDLDVVDFETYMPEDYLPVRVMQFSEYKDWNAVARWADALFPEVKSLPPELNALVSEISKLPDQKARAAAALRWVQEEIRYFSVSFGESSHRPHPPAEVLKQRFGDCKDKSYLLTTLLHRLGIEAQPMLVSLRTPRTPVRLLPMPTVFDHAIVHARIDGSDYYLDGTRLGQRGQLDKIGPTLEGAYGLIVAPDTQALKQITNPNIKALSTISLSEDIKLAGFGDTGTLQSVQRWRGNYAEAMRLAFAQITANQIRQYALSNYELRYANIALTGDPQINDDKEANEISMTATFTIP
ncbi:MAG TPA: DUF3857 domain-containing transglutaminase family protein, partial [Rhodocyclaceae bacterium]|nr:DUF3857 domain-containing transglutaminase family protein [Rhodocyclaceae bacterium]